KKSHGLRSAYLGGHGNRGTSSRPTILYSAITGLPSSEPQGGLLNLGSVCVGRSRVPVDGAAIANDFRVSSYLEQ
ncbi:hypothetical protein AVEN_41307-1, partial [Araneus ventricosus]